MTRSFRFKLALRAMAAVVVGVGVLGMATVVVLRSLLDREIDASILNVAAIQAASLGDGPDGAMHFHEWELTPDEAASVRDLVQYAQVWRDDGISLLRSQYMTSDLPVEREALRNAAAGELVWTEDVFEGSRVRALYYPLERLGAAHEAHVLQVAAPLTRRDQMIGRATAFFAVLLVLVASATFAGAWWLAGTAVRPIHEIIDQAEEIGVGSLDRRIQAYADTLEYRRLVEVLNTMLGRIHQAFEAQRRFTADASHELRSPLTAIRGQIEVALRRPRASSEYVEVLSSTLEEAERLSALSEDLLTLARSDSGVLRLRSEEVDAAEVGRRVVERLAARAEEKGIALQVEADGPTPMSSDGVALGRIVWNLVDNALKFTPEGGRVVLRVEASDGRVDFVVEDTGPGLGPAGSEEVFERFFRADAARTHDVETTGTGLGLAIVKALVDAHGGRIRAEDARTGGARFVVRLPREVPPAEG